MQAILLQFCRLSLKYGNPEVTGLESQLAVPAAWWVQVGQAGGAALLWASPCFGHLCLGHLSFMPLPSHAQSGYDVWGQAGSRGFCLSQQDHHHHRSPLWSSYQHPNHYHFFFFNVLDFIYLDLRHGFYSLAPKRILLRHISVCL